MESAAHWISVDMVLLIISYGGHGMMTSCRKRGKPRNQLDKVQRLACVGITDAMRTAPTRRSFIQHSSYAPVYRICESEGGQQAF